MLYRKLGQTDIEVSAIAMGTWSIVSGRMWGEQDEGESHAAVRAAIDAGINLFDTAEGYGDGRSEQVLGKALAGVRDRAVIATKASSSNLAPDKLVAACEASLKRLNTDRIDLYQIHWPDYNVPFTDTFGAMQRLRDHGKIRAIGVSNFGPQDLHDGLAVCRIESNQLAYSLLFRAAEFDVQPICVEHNIGILCYSPLMHGMLAGKFASAAAVPDERARTRHFSSRRPQTRHGEAGCEDETFAAISAIGAIAKRLGAPMERVALAWLIHQPAVASVIAGLRNAQQAQTNAAAADLALSNDVIAELSEATEPLKQKLGPNLDMWQSEPRNR